MVWMSGVSCYNFLIFCCILHISCAVFISFKKGSSHRIKRDNGAFAKGFGGPVAQGTGPEGPEGEEENVPSEAPVTKEPVITTVKPGGLQPSATPKPEKPICNFEKIPNSVLAVIAYNILASTVPPTTPAAPVGYNPAGPIATQATPSPILTPATAVPSVAPVTSAASAAPAYPVPNVAPVTSGPIVAPVTPGARVPAATAAASLAPAYPVPILAPATSGLTAGPVTLRVSLAPAYPVPNIAPATSGTSVAPIIPGATVPLAYAVSVAPATPAVSAAPATPGPIVAPVTPSLTPAKQVSLPGTQIVPVPVNSVAIQGAVYAALPSAQFGLIRRRQRDTSSGGFKLLSSTVCETPQACIEKCNALLLCNYFVRSVFNFVSYLYEVDQQVLDEGNYTESLNYDSCAKNCGPCIKVISDEVAHKQFDTYLNTFNEKYGDEKSADKGPKKYDSDEERQQRYQIFKDSLQIIQKLNCDSKEGARAGVTEFADQTYEEFISSSGGSSYQLSGSFKADLPEVGAKRIAKCPKFNWVDQGVIPPPRKQGKCGACYAFSTSDLIASQYHIDRKLKGKTFNLSPQYLVDCLTNPAGLGCNGGRPIEVLRNFTSCDATVGCNIPKEECYPYQGKKQQCKQDPCQEKPKIPIRFASMNEVDGPNEKESIAALLHWGPAVVIIDAGPSWQYYGGKGILRSSQCGKAQNHAVLLVGYDYTGSVPYYIIKNSWGPKWGDKGFIKLEAGKNTCSIAKTLTLCCTLNKCDPFNDAKDLVGRPNSEKCI